MSITIERLKQLLADMMIGNTEMSDALAVANQANAALAQELTEKNALIEKLLNAKQEVNP